MRWQVAGVMGLLLWSTPAHAARALWYTGNSGYSSTAAGLTAQLVAAGAAGVDNTSSWPSSLSNYAIIFLAMPSSAFSAAQLTDLTNFHNDGGLVVMMGDNSGFSAANAVLNTLASNLGVNSRISNASNDAGCAFAGRVQAPTHPFMSGVNSVYYAYTSSITLGAGATGLIYRSSANTTIVGYENGVVMSGDVNIFNDSCSQISNNSQFFRNLWDRWCDYDGDGVDRVVCGGTDCDDEDASATASTTFYLDADSDGYGTPSSTIAACSVPSGYSTNDDDCNDSNILINPAATEACDGLDNNCNSIVDDGLISNVWYLDADNDGFGDANNSTSTCDNTAPSGYAQTSTDCNDTDQTINPGANETCDGVDEDCDGLIDNNAIDGSLWYIDSDGDNYGSNVTTTRDCTQPTGYAANSTDCNDANSSIHPNASEYCNSTDDDCDGNIDENAVDGATWYRDVDGDTYGNVAITVASCSAPSGYSGDSTDCDDGDATVNPGATEYCNGSDDNCNGLIDDGIAADGLVWYQDSDGDTYGDPNSTIQTCSLPTGYVGNDDDCNDASAAISPADSETCNNVDDDCDGSVDENATDAVAYYNDSDLDGYGNPSQKQLSCSQPSGYVPQGTDCNDADMAISPDALELCNNIDDDCDGLVDVNASGASEWYADSDADGFGDPNTITDSCDQPEGYTDINTDCNDQDGSAYPGAEEVPYDGIDQDCDGLDEVDADGDTYIADHAGGTDCLDTDPEVYPGAPEVADGVDGDCDGTVDEGTEVFDDDGDGMTENAGDCDDAVATTSPAATELADGVDNDCDGVVDENTSAYDDDGDGVTEDGGDCNDNNAAVNPEATEVLGTGIDENCDGVIDLGEQDEDGDGYLEAGGDCDPENGAISPAATEVADGVDNDCDGLVDAGTSVSDDDGDGVSEDNGDCNDTTTDQAPGVEEVADGLDNDCDGIVDNGTDQADDDGDGFTEQGGDCDDENSVVWPGNPEQVDGLDNDCDGQVDEGADDMDADGYSLTDGDCDDGNGWVNPAVQEICDGLDNDCDGVVDGACDSEQDTGTKATAPTPCGCENASGQVMALCLAGALLLRRRSG